MASLIASLKQRTWTRDDYLITTNPSLIAVKDVNAAFATKEMYWAAPLPDAAMRAFIDNNLCFGVFAVPSPSIALEPQAKTQTQFETEGENPSSSTSTLPTKATLIGFGRLMTDFTTMAYLTDVYIQPSHQGRGLGRWMLSCIQESLESMPYLRGSMLMTGDVSIITSPSSS